MDAIDIRDETARLTEAENARADARGMVFLVAMMLAGALAIVATLSFAGSPESAGPSQTQLSAH